MNWENRLMAKLPLVLGVAFLVIIANALFYFMGVAKIDTHSKAMKARFEANTQSLDDLEAKARQLAGGSSKIATGKAFITKLSDDTFKTRPQRLVQLQEELTTLMKEAGVTSDRIGYKYELLPKKATKGKWSKSYLKTNISITINGSYQQIKNFMRSIHNSPHFLTLEEISVSDTTQGAVMLRASMMLNTYFVATKDDSEI